MIDSETGKEINRCVDCKLAMQHYRRSEYDSAPLLCMHPKAINVDLVSPNGDSRRTCGENRNNKRESPTYCGPSGKFFEPRQ